jgi:hypothetical protein
VAEKGEEPDDASSRRRYAPAPAPFHDYYEGSGTAGSTGSFVIMAEAYFEAVFDDLEGN